MEARKQLIESLPLLTVILIGIAFVNMQGYYDVININIYNYVSTSELILSFVPYLFKFAVTFNTHVITTIVVLQILTYRKNKKKNSEQLEKDENNDSVLSWITLVLFVIICIVGVICLCLNMFYYEPTYKYITQYKHSFYIESTIFFVVMYNVVMTQLPREFRFKNKYFLIAAFIAYLAVSVNKYSFLTGKENILKRKMPFISFFYNGEHIQSSNNNLFYGETSDYIFMYMPKNEMVNIFKKENLHKISRRRYISKSDIKTKPQDDKIDSLNVK